ncbi:MAG: sugar phosphate isomerase/epimerase family protein [Phycisphaeraceae bacterium]
MTNIPRNLGVQSFCFRHFKDNEKVAKMVRDLGVAAIELCAVHADFDKPSSFDDVIRIYRDQGIQIVSIGVQNFRGSDHEMHWFDFAGRAGAKYISANFQPDTWHRILPQIQQACDSYGIRLGIHNHGGSHWLGNSQMLRYILSELPSEIGLCLDTAWCLDAGEDASKWLDEFSHRVYGLHIKDFIFHRNRKPEDVVVGTGNLDLPALLAKCEDIGFGGYAVLEYEGDPNDPVPALKECVQQVRAAAE